MLGRVAGSLARSDGGVLLRASSCPCHRWTAGVSLVVGTGLLLALTVPLLQSAPLDQDEITFKLHQKGFKPGPHQSPNGKFVLKVKGLTAQLYDRATGKAVGRPFKHLDRRPDTRITCWAFSPNSQFLATGAGDPKGKAAGDSAGEVIVWDLARGEDVATISDRNGDVGYVNAVAFKGNRTVLVDCEEISGK